jgi:imidazolonepropionase
VKATRAASLEELIEASRPRLRSLMAGGVTTVESKSGYGMDIETELKMLKAALALEESEAVRIERTLLALHALPAEFKDRREDFVQLAIQSILPAVAAQRLASAVDAYCETIGFTPDEVAALFEAARAHGLAVKLHAEQLSNLHGAALAAEYGALSADHVEHLDEDGVKAMASAGTVAVLLPGAFYALREAKKPPIDLFRKHGVAMAVATDCNPGTSPTLSPTLMLSMACTLFGLTPEEALAGMTRVGAQALGLADETGTISAGKAADLCIWRIGRPAELCYWIGMPGPERRIVAGEDA